MKRKVSFAAICCMVMLAGCQQAEEVMSLNEELVMSIEASIGKINVASRYLGDTPNEVEFATGDKIGLSVGEGEFVEWTFDGASWNPETARVNWNNKDDKHSFTAFYPYMEGASKEGVSMPDLSGQNGTMSSVATRDFLVATKTQTYGTNGVVSFTGDYAFKHVSSLVVVTLKNEGELASATITGISIKGTDILSPSTYSFAETKETSKVSVSADASKKIDLLEVLSTTELPLSCKTYYFVLNSGTVDLKDVILSVKYKKTGENTEYIAKLEGLGTSNVTSFEGGKQYCYSLKVADGVLVVSGNTIEDWGNGLSLEDIVINGSANQGTDDGDNEGA